MGDAKGEPLPLQFRKLGLLIIDEHGQTRIVEFDDPRERFAAKFLSSAPPGVEVQELLAFPGDDRHFVKSDAPPNRVPARFRTQA